MNFARACLMLFFAMGGVVLAGCAVGPHSIRTARQSYNEAIVDTLNEQLLLNLVRLRYGETPYFLEVSSVTSQYTLASSVGIGAELTTRGPNEDTVSPAIGLSYAEQPTVSYAPLHGPEFVKRLLAPMSLESLVLVSQTGWSLDRVLRLTVGRINHIWNAPSASGPTPSRPPRFKAFMETTALLRDLQRERALELEVFNRDGALQLDLRLHSDEVTEAAGREARERLQLDPERDVYSLALGHDSNDQQVVLQTRSLLGAMYYLCQAVDVPERHVEEGRVRMTLEESGMPFDWSELLGDLIRIRSTTDRPSNAAVAVFHRQHWFYIDDTDLESKSTFGLLVQLFYLQSGESDLIRPLLTIPVGG